ncbi:type II toxin-antitoxin system VapC family toxin [Actinomycetes bacterium KLBMP 9759]
MKVLLDTSVMLELSLDASRLRSEVVETLTADATTLIVSVISPWEIGIKWRLGKLPLPQHPTQWTQRLVREFGATVMPINLHHVNDVADLPAHHRDPFDRLLIAQARAEGIPIVTTDRQFAAYDVETIAAR